MTGRIRFSISLTTLGQIRVQLDDGNLTIAVETTGETRA